MLLYIFIGYRYFPLCAKCSTEIKYENMLNGSLCINNG